MKNTEDRKQELIVRQAQINSTIEYFKLIGKKPSMTDVLKISTMLEQFIYKGYSKQFMEDVITKVDEHINTIK
jgi:beta-lactam-binding protein with PASTA domain